MDLIRISRCSTISLFEPRLAAGALALAGLLHCAPAAAAERQTLEVARTNSKTADGRRMIVERVRTSLQTPAYRTDHDLTRTLTYAGTRLAAFERDLKSSLSEAPEVRVAERSRVVKNGRGDFTGALERAYSFGRGSKASSVLVTMRFEPFLLVKSNDVKILVRHGDGAPPTLASGSGESLWAAFRGALRELETAPMGRRESAAKFLASVWMQSLALEGVLPWADLMYPLLEPGGNAFVKETNVDLLIRRTRIALEAARERPEELVKWLEISRNLNRTRPKPVKGGMARGFGPYQKALRPLFSPPPRRLSSRLQDLHETGVWLESSLQALDKSDRSFKDSGYQMNEGIARWRTQRASRLADVYLHALYVLQIAKETIQLERVIQRASTGGSKPDRLLAPARDLREHLRVASLAWGAGAQPGPGGAALYGMLTNIPGSLSGMPVSFGHVYLNPGSPLPLTPEEAYSEESLELVPGPTLLEARLSNLENSMTGGCQSLACTGNGGISSSIAGLSIGTSMGSGGMGASASVAGGSVGAGIGSGGVSLAAVPPPAATPMSAPTLSVPKLP